jgi:hypothetical protein
MNQFTPQASISHHQREAADWLLVAAVNDEEVLRQTLLRSPDLEARCQIILKRGFPSAPLAYNAGMAEAAHEVLIFVHQDVYLPRGWMADLWRALEKLASLDSDWGVLGVYGVATDGHKAGHVYSTGLGGVLGEPFTQPLEATSLDELLLVTRRSANLRFDEELPGFHLYGADICFQAARRGLKSYIIPAFCVHNSNGIPYLPKAYWRSYFYMRRKWWAHLPLETTCTRITQGYGPVLESFWSALRHSIVPIKVGARSPDPELVYRSLGLRDAEGPGKAGAGNPPSKNGSNSCRA